MRYPKKKPIQCSIAFWANKGYYCYNTQQKLDHGGDTPQCVACRKHYEVK